MTGFIICRSGLFQKSACVCIFIEKKIYKNCVISDLQLLGYFFHLKQHYSFWNFVFIVTLQGIDSKNILHSFRIEKCTSVVCLQPLRVFAILRKIILKKLLLLLFFVSSFESVIKNHLLRQIFTQIQEGSGHFFRFSESWRRITQMNHQKWPYRGLIWRYQFKFLTCRRKLVGITVTIKATYRFLK